MIKIKQLNNNEFQVTITEGNTSSEHKVTLDDNFYNKLTQGKKTKQDLLKDSFEFLLEREAKESILSEFNLKLIQHYFPEYESKISN
jgi:hypothetical protein